MAPQASVALCGLGIIWQEAGIRGESAHTETLQFCTAVESGAGTPEKLGLRASRHSSCRGHWPLSPLWLGDHNLGSRLDRK